MISYSPEADALLKQAETLVTEIAAAKSWRVETNLWVWDSPNVLVLFSNDGEIGRNLNLVLEHVDGPGSPEGLFQVEINAWKDYDEPSPKRRWRSERFPGLVTLQAMKQSIYRAVEKVFAWTEEDLVQSSPRISGVAS